MLIKLQLNKHSIKPVNLWWLLTAAGSILFLLGIFCLTSPLNAYIFLIHYSGLTLACNGILLMIVFCTSASSLPEREWLLAEAVLDILFAFCLLFNPFMTFIAFPFIIGPWIIAKGILKILAVLRLRNIRGGMFILLSGLLSVLFGILIIYSPLERADGITILTGSFALIIGSLYIFDSIRFRKLPDTLNLML